MGWTALVKADLTSLSKSWVVRGWIAVLALTHFVTLSAAVLGNRVVAVPASALVSGQLASYLLVWSTVIIVLAAGSVSLEADMIADSILSRSCTRTQFIAAKLASRALVIVGVYLLFSSVSGYVAWRYAGADVTLGTVATAVGIVGMAILLLVAIGVAMSVIFNNTIVAVIGLLLLWYVAAPVFSFMGAEYLSPTSLVRNLPRILKDPHVPQLVQCTATASTITVVFSKDMDAGRAERPECYQIEPEGREPVAAQAAVYDKAKTSVLLTGLELKPDETVRVTVRGVTDPGGAEVSAAANTLTAVVPPDAAKPGEATAAKKPAPPRDRTPPRVLSCTATTSSLRILFNRELDAKDAIILDHYLVESPPGHPQPARAATYEPAPHAVLLSGLQFDNSEPVKVTVKDLKGSNGIPIATSGNSATYSEVTVWKYVLGFGIPTLCAALLAAFWFTRRDL